MGKIKKTNAVRILDKNKIEYRIYNYEADDGNIDGLSVAQKIGKEPLCVYKTLVAQGNSKELFVFVIPVSNELDLKKAAVAAGEKKIEMIPVKTILNSTGYIRGGCSPIGMKKRYETFLDSSADKLDDIIVSGGRIGTQIELSVEDLLKSVGGKVADLIK